MSWSLTSSHVLRTQFKLPEKILIVDQIPKTATGKVSDEAEIYNSVKRMYTRSRFPHPT
jgi:non-ribosomal peptide synthetase component E (peptide arylation enzyme)